MVLPQKKEDFKNNDIDTSNQEKPSISRNSQYPYVSSRNPQTPYRHFNNKQKIEPGAIQQEHQQSTPNHRNPKQSNKTGG